MSEITTYDVPGLPVTGLYHQVSVATGSRLVSLAGQVSQDADGTPVGVGDLAAQIEQCYANVATALAGAGGSIEDVVDLTAYVVDWSADKVPALVEGMARGAARVGTTHTPPATLIGVASLFTPEQLVELKVTAVLA
ncbi:RidA family protein [uncultured Nocardioides sp.]|uniref:RidA family protein n=1 Tax=uncultured Nocardioides sp. TaxID=198441 RepID=UPI00262B7F5B|nr:RidA family protein [uncultured Nocardioides sp.]